MRWLRRMFLALLILAVAGTVLGVWTVRRSFPVVEGELRVAALHDPVTITRDAAGVPLIVASTTHDLFLAQGYAHAQDRFWQMDTWRHVGAGRLSELFGRNQLETDAFLRTLGFRDLAEEAYAQAPDHIRQALQSYAEGVNAYLEERAGGAPLSMEYTLLGLQNPGYRPEPWQPADTLTWAHVMAWDLRSNLDDEITRAVLSEVVGTDRAEQLYPDYPPGNPLIVTEGGTNAGTPADPLPGDALAAVARAGSNVATVEMVLGRPLDGLGSNSWVVDGSLTESGAPLLANDPHLGIQIPSIWYQVRLWCVEAGPACPYRVTGFTFPGAPGVVVGHNENIAWGVTNLAPDTMDLYIERTDGAGNYEIDGEWVPFEEHTEVISVAGGEEVPLLVRRTRHGPIISGRYGDVDDLAEWATGLPDSYEVALRWRALEPSTVVESLLSINLAADWDEFRAAASLFDIAPQNLVYADREGHIGYQATGQIPIRASGDGRYPVPGWTSEYGWLGWIPYEALPSVLDPASGFIVTANQPLVDDSYPYLIGHDQRYGYRAARITELLDVADPLTAEDMNAIQIDTHDASARVVVAAVQDLDAVAGSPVSEMQEILARWSIGPAPFRMDPASAGAAAYGALWRSLLRLTFDDELPAGYEAPGGGRFFRVIEELLADRNDPWWNDATTDITETADMILARALVEAHTELTEQLGADPDSWRWGDLHLAHFDHATLGQSGVAPIEALFNRRAPREVGGGTEIVNATSWLPPEGYEVLALPSMRMVVDMADLSESRWSNSTGQSGHAFHRNYDDMIGGWARGELFTLPFGREVDDGRTLTLMP